MVAVQHQSTKSMLENAVSGDLSWVDAEHLLNDPPLTFEDDDVNDYMQDQECQLEPEMINLFHPL